MKNKGLLLFTATIFIISSGFWVIDFPKVPDSPRRLFYIQRNSNINTIVYDANLLANGNIDPEDPVDVYWLRYQEQGQRKELSWIQNILAYGIDTKPVSVNNFEAWIVSYKKKKLKITLDNNRKPYATIEINKKSAKLEHVFVKIEGSNLKPSVLYVELFGKDLMTKNDVYEKIKP